MFSVGTKLRACSPECPFCAYSDLVVPIFYGMPTPEMLECSRRREVALGGGSLGPDLPAWYCKGCMRAFHLRNRDSGTTYRAAAASNGSD